MARVFPVSPGLIEQGRAPIHQSVWCGKTGSRSFQRRAAGPTPGPPYGPVQGYLSALEGSYRPRVF
eukprot:gene17793-biopygen23372